MNKSMNYNQNKKYIKNVGFIFILIRITHINWKKQILL